VKMKKKTLLFPFVTTIVYFAAGICSIFISWLIYREDIAQSVTDIHKVKSSIFFIFILISSAFIFFIILKLQTKLKKYQENENKIKSIDYLTGLQNRYAFYETMEKLISQKENFAVVLADIDDFKTINDSLGHSIGDEFIVHLSNVLRKNCSDKELLFKVGGDEFVFLLKYTDKTSIKEFCNDILDISKNSVMIAQNALEKSISLGIAIYPHDGKDKETLMKAADMSLYKAKESGKNKFFFFEKNIHQKMIKRFLAEKNLQSAFENDTIEPFFQPIFSLQENRIVGFESLMRMKCEDHCFNAEDVVRVAEESGKIIEIGQIILEKACKFMQVLKNNGYDDLYFSVNFSLKEVAHDKFKENILNTLKKYGFKNSDLCIEITENIFMDDMTGIIEKIKDLKEAGIKIALDDFGKGYSSLRYIKDLPINILKIDKAFINELTIIDVISDLARRLGLSVVVEGVEDLGHLENLSQKSQLNLQGFYIGRPMDKKQFLEFLHKGFSIEKLKK